MGELMNDTNNDYPETVKCSTCGKVYTVAKVLERWEGIPFYDVETDTFYCGCYGWE